MLMFSDGLKEMPVPTGLLGLVGVRGILKETIQLTEIHNTAVARSDIPEKPETFQ